MANVFFIGGVSPVAQKYRLVVAGAWAAGDTATVTINSKTVTVTVLTGATTVGEVTAQLFAALRSPTGVAGEFRLLSWVSGGTDSIIATGPEDGRPVSVSSSESTTGSGTLTTTALVASSSPHDAANTANWSTGGLPGNSDVAVFDRDVPVLYGLSGLTGVTCAIRRTANHRSAIGLPDVNPLGFKEYLPTKLLNSGTEWDIVDTGSGTVRLSLENTASDAVAVSITGDRRPDAIRLDLWGSIAIWTIASVNGSCRINEGASIASITATSSVISVPNLLSTATASFNDSIAQIAATVTTSVDVLDGSDVTFLADSSFGSNDDLTITGAIARWQSTGSAGDIVLGTGGVFDATQAPSAFAVESFEVQSGAAIDDPYERITKPVTITLDGAAAGSLRLNLGRVSSLAVS